MPNYSSEADLSELDTKNTFIQYWDLLKTADFSHFMTPKCHIMFKKEAIKLFHITPAYLEKWELLFLRKIGLKSVRAVTPSLCFSHEWPLILAIFVTLGQINYINITSAYHTPCQSVHPLEWNGWIHPTNQWKRVYMFRFRSTMPCNASVVSTRICLSVFGSRKSK